MATTTATRNTGILEYLLPLLKQALNINVQIVAAEASEDALKLGQEGAVDVVLTHEEDLEKQLVDKGYFIDREDIMYDDYILLGPVHDPARIRGIKTATEAFKKIRSAKAAFVSRGDNSDTNMRENRIWAMTGVMPERSDTWYFTMEQGTGTPLTLAGDRQAYTLTSRVSWYSMENKGKPGLTIVLEGDPILHNQYGVMIVNPKNHKSVNYQSAMNFVIWLSSPAGQNAIAAFRDTTGNALYTPNAQ